MKEGKVIVEQVSINGDLEKGHDNILSSSEIFSCLQMSFPNISKDLDNGIIGNYKGFKYAIRIKNITYLGNPHPIYKKRIQISSDLKEFYSQAKAKGFTPLLLGVYSYKENLTFVDFNIEDFIQKKAHNSSAHIMTSDLSEAAYQGIYQKYDFFENKITAFRKDFVSVYFENLIFEINENQKFEQIVAESFINQNYSSDKKVAAQQGITLKPTVMPLNHIIPIMNFFNIIKHDWYGKDCYREMISENYRNKFQPEWGGFYLEFLFEKYITNQNLLDRIRYAQEKEKEGVDLDLYFPKLNCYGDLKCHSISSQGIQGNDESTVVNQIKCNGHVFYKVGEHVTVKDSDFNYEVTKYWNSFQQKEDLMSYANKMKNRIILLKSYILDINANNYNKLTQFKQGVNSDGKLRKPKIMINTSNIEDFKVSELIISGVTK